MAREAGGVRTGGARGPGLVGLAGLLLGLLVAWPPAPAAARPEGPAQTDPRSGYALAATWSDLGTPTRVVTGPDGRVYALSDQGIVVRRADGTADHVLPGGAPALREIAVDGEGNVYGASGGDVRRLAADGRRIWATEVKSEKPSVLIPYEMKPYVASLAWNHRADMTLLYDRWQVSPSLEWSNQAVLEYRATANGQSLPGPEMLFPSHSYWDLDYVGEQAYVLNRATTELRTQPQVERYDPGGAAAAAPIPLPAPTERIAVHPDGSVFALSEFRWVYHLAADGRLLDAWDAAGSRPGLRSRVTDLAVDAAGTVYVADPEQRELRVYTRQQGVVNPVPRPGGSGLACRPVPNKWAEPTLLRLGEATQVTLTLGGDCPTVAERADIVLVVDQSNSMSYENGAKMAAAKAGVRTFVDMVDTSKHQLGLVAFASFARLAAPLSFDKQTLLSRLDGLEPLGGSEGGTDIAGGLDAAVAELASPRARRDERTKPIVILLTDGVAFNTTRLSTVAAADRARYEAITVFAIGFGADVDAELLRLVARTPDLYEFAPDAATLQAIYSKLGRYISAEFLWKSVTIVDEIPRNMKYRPDLGADPEPLVGPGGHTLTWRFGPVGFAPPLTMRYWLEPLEVGTWPTNVQAIYDGPDGFDQPQRGPFPIPRVVVWAPTETPTATTPAPPTATATRTASATRTVTPSPSPSRTWTPRPTVTGTREPPTLTPTRRVTPTPTPTRTPTRTPSPTLSPTPGATPTATPMRYEVYTTILFNDKCFQRYADVVLVLDASTTMLRRGNDGRQKLEAAKAAARAFMDIMEFGPDLTGRHDQVALAWFNDTAVIQQGLTNDRAALDRALEAIRPVEGSRLDLGLWEAHMELMLSPYRVLANNPVIVFLSDGIPNRTTVGEIIRQSDEAKLDAISLYTVGFGEDVRDEVMVRVASQPEMYYRSRGNTDLEPIYREIAGQVVCR